MSESKEPEVKEPEYNEEEVEAISMGWKPKEQHGDTGFIEPGEFIRRKPLFDKIDSYNKKVKSVEQSLKDLTVHHKRVRETEYNRAYKELQTSYRSSMEDGDTIAALEIHDKMDDLQGTRRNEMAGEPVEQPAGPSAEYTEWVSKNKWYETDTEMNEFADSVAQAYVNKNGQTAENVIFKHVESQIKRAFPEKFENPNRNRPGAVGKGDVQQKGTPKAKVTLTHEQESVARRWERMGVMTREDYVKELQSMEE